ncbi:MAG: GAF domain-containing protein [Cyanobacteria bacterium P01_A01_bin.17]
MSQRLNSQANTDEQSVQDQSAKVVASAPITVLKTRQLRPIVELPFHQLQFRQLRALAMRQLPSPQNSQSTPTEVSLPTPPQKEEQRTLPSVPPSTGPSMKAKVTLWALSVSVLPTLLVGLGSYTAYQSLRQQAEGQPSGLQIEARLDEILPPLAMGTGLMAVMAGAIATLLARRTIQPALQASRTSTTLVNRLQRADAETQLQNRQKDELKALEANVSLIGQQLPSLLATQQEETQKFQVLMEITDHLQNSQTEENLLSTAVISTRKLLRTDRVSVFRFNASGEGTFVAEDVGPGWAKLLWSTIHDPCFDSGYSALYQEGRVKAIDNIYTANLSDCHIGLLEQFGVKANLIAPIIKAGQLFGLLIAHQCSGPRPWQTAEIEVVTQVAAQISAALHSAHMIQRLNEQAEQTHQLLTVSRSIRSSLDEEDVLSTTTTEVRKALKADRVVVYTFDTDWYGTVVAESVLPGFSKALWAEIHDPCFAEGFVEKYQAGRIHAINNIQSAGLGDCYLQQLEAFEVKANLVAPILKDNQLFGLLIAHQCSGPRQWQQTEQNFIGQIALQVGYALEHARFAARLDAEDQKARLIKSLTQSIRASLIEEDILSTTVTEMRKALKADRMIIYGFDADWYGTVVAEAVLPGFPKTLWAEIKDPCFAEGFVKQYQSGRAHSIPDVQSASIGECYRQQLEQFGIRANLVVPILKDQQLFGLLIAHQCSGPRHWQTTDITLMTQVAQQVGYALDHARLLAQIDQAYQLAQGTSTQNQQQRENLQRQISTFLAQSKGAIQHLADQNRQQMVSVSTLYNHIKALADSTQGMVRAFEQGEQHSQQVKQGIQTNQAVVKQMRDSITALETIFTSAAEQIQVLGQPAQQLDALITQVNALAAEVKLQAMNVTLESARKGSAGQEFADIGEKIHALARELDSGLTEVKPLVQTIRANVQNTSNLFINGQQQTLTSTQSVVEIQQQLGQVAASSYQLLSLLGQMTQAATNQAHQSEAANHSAVEVANLTNHTAETSAAVVESFNRLTSSVEAIEG